MANLAVFVSGNGSNFEAIAEAVAKSSHAIVCMICDRSDAPAFERAQRLGVPSFHVSYRGRQKAEVEKDIFAILSEKSADLIALAGFMRLLTPELIDRYPGRIINVHPSLLPKYPGTNGIKEAFDSEDSEIGITVHRVDYGLDTGPIIMQNSFTRRGDESLEMIELDIHRLEHKNYPAILLEILDAI